LLNNDNNVIKADADRVFHHAHGGNVEKALRRYGVRRENIVDFSANINPLGPPLTALEALKRNLDLIAQYPDPDCTLLKKKLGEYLGVDASNLLIGNGASESIYLVGKMLSVGKVIRALIPAPSFSEYASAVMGVGGEVVFLPLREEEEFIPDVNAICKAMDGCRVIFLCNPNNPTGCLYTRESILRVVREAQRQEILVVIDEAFMDFVENKGEASVLKDAVHYNNLIILGSLTKIFALPGLRLGFAAAGTRFIKVMERLKDPWSVNSLAQVAGAAALEDREYLRKTYRLLSKQKDYLYRALNAIDGLQAYSPAANFILVNSKKSGVQSAQLVEILGRRGILLRNCDNFPFLDKYFFRVAVRTEAENNLLIDALREALRSIQKHLMTTDSASTDA